MDSGLFLHMYVLYAHGERAIWAFVTCNL